MVTLAWLFPYWNILICFQECVPSSGWTVILLLILFSKGTIPWVILCDSFLVFRAVSSVLFWKVLFLEHLGYCPPPMKYGLQRSCHMILFSPGRVWRSHGCHQREGFPSVLLGHVWSWLSSMIEFSEA